MDSESRSFHDGLPVLKAEGNHYDVGVKIGVYFQSRIKAAVKHSASLQEVLLPYYRSAEGRAAVDCWLATSTSRFPHYVEELRGYSSGSGVDFINLFLLHVETEILTLQGMLTRNSDGCSDLYLMNQDESLWVHTEDVRPDIQDGGYVLDLHITREENCGTVEEVFKSYAYPGMLPGNTFGFNEHGLVITVNVIFQAVDGISLNGLPRRILNRATLPVSSLEAAVAVNTGGPGAASGCNYSIGRWTEDGEVLNLYSLEVASKMANAAHSVKKMQGFDHHFNNYLLLAVSQVDDPSSLRRERRLKEVNKPVWTAADVLALISDTHDPEYPFYRNGKPPDYLATAATAVFDFKKRLMLVYRGVAPSADGAVPALVCEISHN